MNPPAKPKPFQPTRRRLRWLWPLLFVIAVATMAGGVVFGWQPFVHRYAPMTERWSQCQVCERHRDEKWILKTKTRDVVTENECSRWIDTFMPEHDHIWSISSGSDRETWFGSQVMGCGGDPALYSIYRQRADLGEAKAQALVKKYADFARAPRTKDYYQQRKTLTGLITRNPDAALEWKP
jgi:hypothetical protein